MVTLRQTSPALPVRDAAAGTREFATLDRDGNLITFFESVE